MKITWLKIIVKKKEKQSEEFFYGILKDKGELQLKSIG